MIRKNAWYIKTVGDHSHASRIEFLVATEACPHDVGPGIAMCCRQSCYFRIEGPHDHPVRRDGHCRAGSVIWIGITVLSSTRKHVCDPWNGVGWLRFMRRKIKNGEDLRFDPPRLS